MAQPDWDKIRAEYIADEKSSYRKIAEKYGVTFPAVKCRATREGWYAAKKKARERIVRKATQKLLDKQAARIAGEIDPALQATELLNNVVLKTLQDAEQFNRHLVQVRERNGEVESWDVEERIFDVVDTKRLRDLAAALKATTELQRLIKGLLDPLQEERLKLEKERLELDKRKSEKDIAILNGDVNIVLEGDLDEWAR